MDEKKSRTLLFVLGISIGLLLGATAVYVSTPKSTGNGEVSENMIEQIVNKVYGLISLKKEEQDSLNQKVTGTKFEREKSSSKNLEKSTINQNDSASAIAQKAANVADSAHVDSANSNALTFVNSADDIVVKKDELLLTKSIELVNLDFSTTKSNTRNDSLLQIVSGVRETPKATEAKSSFQVELWQSPINYKGYKMSKTKLVLFGIDEDAPLRLILLDKNTYLKCADAFFKLDNYNDFKSFEKVSNAGLISQLNKLN